MIDWLAFLIVFVASLGSACLVVALYSLGIRFLATPASVAAEEGALSSGAARDDEDDDVDDLDRPKWATVAAYTCFGLSVVCVLVGIYLIVPALHG